MNMVESAASMHVSFVFGIITLGIFFHTAGSKESTTAHSAGLHRLHELGCIKTNVLCDQDSLSSSCPAVYAISLWHRGGWWVQQNIWSRPMGEKLLIIKHSLNWRKGGHPSVTQRKCLSVSCFTLHCPQIQSICTQTHTQKKCHRHACKTEHSNKFKHFLQSQSAANKKVTTVIADTAKIDHDHFILYM